MVCLRLMLPCTMKWCYRSWLLKDRNKHKWWIIHFVLKYDIIIFTKALKAILVFIISIVFCNYSKIQNRSTHKWHRKCFDQTINWNGLPLFKHTPNIFMSTHFRKFLKFVPNNLLLFKFIRWKTTSQEHSDEPLNTVWLKNLLCTTLGCFFILSI